MALFIVIAAIAVATILGMVMLSTATLANASGANQLKLGEVQSLGESGINLAAYYLQNPPSGNSSSYWSGTGGVVAIGSEGTVNVSVTQAVDSDDDPIANTYEVSCVAAAGTTLPVTRTYQARLVVQTGYTTTWGSVFNNDVALIGGTTINGDFYTSGKLNSTLSGLVSGATITGSASATAIPLLGVTIGGSRNILTTPTVAQAPTVSDINLYTTYKYNGILCSATVLTSSTLTGTLAAANTTTNPAQIYYYDAKSTPLTLGANAKINGTLIVANGDLWIRGANVQINPQQGYPALVVWHNLDIAQPGLLGSPNGLTANGVVFVGNQLSKSGTNPLQVLNSSVLTVNGSLLCGSTGTPPFASGYNIITNLTFSTNNAAAPDITTNPALRHPIGVSIVRWGPP